MIVWLFSTVFLLSGLIINCIQLLLYLFLKPFSKRCYRTLNYYLCYSLYSQLVFVADWCSQTKVMVWTDEDDLKNFIGKEHALLIHNHSYEINWIVGSIFADKCNVLGNLKGFVDTIAAHTPIIGWTWKFSDFIFLKNCLPKDKKTISKQLGELRSYSDPVWLAFFPEGSCFTSEKHEESAEFALSRGVPVLKHLLIPRTKGFVKCLASLRNNYAIYDINIAFKEDEAMPILPNIFDYKGVKAYMFMRRIVMSSVPENEEQAAQWLQELFREKDKILESFHTTGSFFETSGFKEPKSFVSTPRWSTLMNFLAWTMVFVLPVVYYIVPYLVHRTWLGLVIPLTIPIIYYLFMHIFLKRSKFNTVFSCWPKERT